MHFFWLEHLFLFTCFTTHNPGLLSTHILWQFGFLCFLECFLCDFDEEEDEDDLDDLDDLCEWHEFCLEEDDEFTHGSSLQDS